MLTRWVGSEAIAVLYPATTPNPTPYLTLPHASVLAMSEATTTEFVRARYYRLASEPTLPFVWWGLLPLLLFFAVLLFGVTHFAGTVIEGTVERDTKSALRSQGYSDVQVEVDGQDVHLTGFHEKDLDQVTQIAKSVAGSTMFGELTSPMQVTAEADAFKPKLLPVDALPASAPVLPWADMAARLENGELVLTGDVQSKEIKLEIGEQARGLLQPPRLSSVRNELRVTARQVREGSSYLAKHVVASIAGCDRGEASVQTGVFAMTCATSAEAEADIRGIAASPLNHGKQGAIEILLSESIDKCEDAFASILKGKTIQFAVGSAELRPSSNVLLDKVAETAKSCPGVLRVEGHTDDTGALEANMMLSKDRAKSVCAALTERGVETTRLRPQGLGPTRPRAVGKTFAARSQNRRIEFHVTIDNPNTQSNRKRKVTE